MPHNLSIFSFQFSPFLARRRRRVTKGGCNIKKTPDESRAFAFFGFRWLGLCDFRFDRKDGDDGTTFSRTEVDGAVN